MTRWVGRVETRDIEIWSTRLRGGYAQGGLLLQHEDGP